jgi:signal transduction histidine kinase
MDMAKGEMGILKLNLEKLDVSVILRDVVEDFNIAALRQHKSLKLDIPACLPLIRCDEGRVRQIIQNLINNAIKFTNEGDSIILKARVDANGLLITVRDSGQGISKRDQLKIFKLYSSVQKGKDYHGGLGLGLALCKMLCELHGGQIWVESEPNKGSEFNFVLPLGPPDKK